MSGRDSRSTCSCRAKSCVRIESTRGFWACWRPGPSPTCSFPRRVHSIPQSTRARCWRGYVSGVPRRERRPARCDATWHHPDTSYRVERGRRLMVRHSDPEVLVVGAGPVGLAAALFLQQSGVRVEIIDMHVRTTQHSYALAIHPRTLQVLEEAGLADALVDRKSVV